MHIPKFTQGWEKTSKQVKYDRKHWSTILLVLKVKLSSQTNRHLPYLFLVTSFSSYCRALKQKQMPTMRFIRVEKGDATAYVMKLLAGSFPHKSSDKRMQIHTTHTMLSTQFKPSVAILQTLRVQS